MANFEMFTLDVYSLLSQAIMQFEQGKDSFELFQSSATYKRKIDRWKEFKSLSEEVTQPRSKNMKEAELTTSLLQLTI